MTGRKRKYCGPTCYASYKPKSPMGLTECQNCGTPLTANVGKGRPKRNCSRLCRERHRQNQKRKPLATHNCEHCGKHFATNYVKPRFCSKQCRQIVNKIEGKTRFERKQQQKYPGGIRTTPCSWCKEPRTWKIGESVITAYHPKCTIEARRARYRIKTVKRQSQLQKPSRLAADEVVRVYGSNCAICNDPIDLALKRTSPRGLTVDHWIPLSKGGSDNISNLRPAHWSCNRKKSNKLPEEVNA
jgi:5-methylcytosine-specific restriction endonuclease McrA